MRRAGGLLALAFLAAHSAVFLAGRTLLPIAPSMTTVPGAPYGYRGPLPDTTTTLDPMGALNISYANDTFTAEALAGGRLPFWNGHQAFGAPFLTSGHPGVLYPLAPLLTLLPRSSYDFLYLLNWYLAALCTYFYLRLIDVGEAGALVGGAAVAASGFFQYYLPFREASTTAACFPALLYAVERTLREPGWRWRHAAIALATYCAITAGQPEVTAVALTAATLYGLGSLAWHPRPRVALAALLPGAICGALLTAPFWWNFSDYAFGAYSSHRVETTHGESALGWRTLAAYITPQLYGRVQTLPPWMVPDGWSWDLSPGWITAAVAFGALFGVWRAAASRSRPLLLLIALGIVEAGKTWGIPPFTLIARLPIFDTIVYPRYGAFILAFVAAFLAGAGWEFAASKAPREWLRVAVVWIAIAAGLYLLTGIWRQSVFTAIQVKAFSALAWMWIAAVPAALWWLRARGRADGASIAIVVSAAMLLQLVAYMPGYPPETYAVLTVGCLGAWLMLTLFAGLATRPPLVTLTLAACVCVAPELVLSLSDSRGLPRRYDPTTPPPYAGMLRTLQTATGGRAYAIDGTPQPNFAMPLGLDTLNKCDPLQPLGAALFVKQRLDRGADPVCFSGNANTRIQLRAIDEFRTNRRFFNLAAIRYLVTRTTAIHPAAEDPRMRLAAVDGAAGVQIWEDLDAGPRAFLACPAARAASMDEALAKLPGLNDLRREIVVEGDAPACAPGAPLPNGTLESYSAHGNDVTVRHRADAPGVLVVVDAYQDGWRARVDGAPVEILRVDGAFLGVPIRQAGSHVVELSYRPPNWRASCGAAAAGAGVLLVAAFAPARRKGV